MFVQHIKKKIDFVMRIQKGNYKEADELFDKNSSINSKIVTLVPSKDIKSKVKKNNYACEITIRFVRVLLDNGEIEILATSLLDEGEYPSESFKELYHYRWGIETFYDLLKNRLELENFTGKSLESIKQDFYSALLISNIETLLTEDVQKELDLKVEENKLQKKGKHQQQKINKNVSFHTIKERVFELFNSKKNIDDTLMEMEMLFKLKPMCVRKDRKTNRVKPPPRRALRFHKNKKKHCY